MATLTKDAKGKLERFKITPVVADGHAGLEGVNGAKLYDKASGGSCACKIVLSLTVENEAALLAEILGEVAKAVAVGATLSTEKYAAEFWVAADHGAVEDEAFAYPTFSYAADGPVAAYSEKKCVKWVPSDAVKAALLASATK